MQTFFFGMATAVLQDALVWMLWLLIAQTSCGGVKSSPKPSIEQVRYYGHLTIGTKKLNLLAEVNPTAYKTELFSKSIGDNTDYQSDSHSHVWMESDGVTEGFFGHKRTLAVDRLLGMKPKVQCVENSMTLKLQGAAPLRSPVLIDRGNAHPLSLSKMPPDCGYTIRRGWRDLAFSTPYDGCFVTREDSIYVLPLVIYGIPVRMACPSIAPKPPSVSCHESGMTVKVESSISVKDIKVKVNSKWELLMNVSPQCGFSVIEHPEGVIISAPYLPCIKEKDGMLTFEVAAEGDFKISCPAQPLAMHARATACPESSSTGCSTTQIVGPSKGPQTEAPGYSVKPQHLQIPVPLATQESHTDTPVQFPAQFPFYYFKPELYQPYPKPHHVAPSPEPELSEVPQLPPVSDLHTTQAPLVPVKKPVLVEDPSKNMHFHIPEHAEFPVQFPFYYIKPEFNQPKPKPDQVSPSPAPEPSEVPQVPPMPVFQATQAPPVPVHTKKPVVVEGPSKSRPSDIPKPAQFPFYVFNPEFYQHVLKPDHVFSSPEPEPSEVPQVPSTPVFQATQAPPGPVHPKKPVVVEGFSKSQPSDIPKPAQFPFYVFNPEFYQPDVKPKPKPDCVSSSPEPEPSEVPQVPPMPVFQATQAPPGPVHTKKPVVVEGPSKSQPSDIPKPAQFPFYVFNPEFYQPDVKPKPKPDCVSPNPEPEPSEVPQVPLMPVFQATQAPPVPVHTKKPVFVESPSKSRPSDIPKPAQFPFYVFNPEFYQHVLKPDHVFSSPEPEPSEVPQVPLTPVFQATQAPPGPVHTKKPVVVEGSSKSQPSDIPKPAQFPFYVFNPEFYQPDVKPKPKPDCVSPSPEPEPSEVPQVPLMPVFQATQAPPVPVHTKKPVLVEGPSKSIPSHIPKPIHFPEQFPFYVFKPEFNKPGPKSDRVFLSPEPDHSEAVFQATQAPPAPVYPKKPVEGPTKSTTKPIQLPPQFPYYFFMPGFNQPDPKPDKGFPSPKPKPKEEPQLPKPPVPQTTQVTPKQLVTHPSHTSPKQAHSPTEAPIHQMYQFYPVIYPLPPNSGYSVPTAPQKPKLPTPQNPDVPSPTSETELGSIYFLNPPPKTELRTPTNKLESRHQSTHCLTACTVAHSNCCALALSFHQHVHHHNHFAPAFGQMVQPATSDKELSLIQRLINHSPINSINRQVPHRPTVFGAPQKPTSSSPSVQTGSHQETEANSVHMPKPDPDVKPISSLAHQINPPFFNSYMYIPANGHWSPVPAIITSSVPLTQPPASKLHSKRTVKEPSPYQQLQYPYGLPNPKSMYRLGPDNPANNLEGKSISTAKDRDQVAEDHHHKGTRIFSPIYPWFHNLHSVPDPPPTTKPDSQTERETYHHQSVSPVLNMEAPKSALPQRGSHPFLNSFLRQRMVDQRQSIPDVSSDSPKVPFVLSKYSTLKHPVASAGPPPQKLYWGQAVPDEATVYNGYPKAPFKSDASEVHPQNISPQNSSSTSSGESSAPLESSQSFQNYWKPVEPHHS